MCHCINLHCKELGWVYSLIKIILCKLYLFFRDVDCLDLSNIKGIIINIPYQLSIGFLKLPFTRKHWLVIREIEGVFFNLDSKLVTPEKIGSIRETIQFLREILKTGDRELLLVVDSEVEKTGSWKRTMKIDKGGNDT